MNDPLESITEEQLQMAIRLRKVGMSKLAIPSLIGVSHFTFFRHLEFLKEQRGRCERILGKIFSWDASEKTLREKYEDAANA